MDEELENEDETEDSEDEGQTNDQAPFEPLAPQAGAPIPADGQPPLSDMANQPLSDGDIPINSQGIASGQINALDPNGFANITFEQGNYQQIKGSPKTIQNKVVVFTQTFVPLIEVALIELLGSTNMYLRQSGNCEPVFEDNGQFFIDFTLIYVIDSWISMDVDPDAIKSDANYILQKLQTLKGINLSQVTIDTTEGTLTIAGRL
jgi:hypothetical protein